MSINQNITSLQSLLDQVNNLPDAGGVELPVLTNEGIADDLVAGKELINSEGNIVTGTNPYEKVATDTEVNTQADLIAQIKSTVDSLPEANIGSNTIDTCNVTITSFNNIHFLSYTTYENNLVDVKCLTDNNTVVELTNVICGSAISFFNEYEFNGFTHSHDSKFIENLTRHMYVLSAPTEPNVNATIRIFDDD